MRLPAAPPGQTPPGASWSSAWVHTRPKVASRAVVWPLTGIGGDAVPLSHHRQGDRRVSQGALELAAEGLQGFLLLFHGAEGVQVSLGGGNRSR